MAVNVLVLEDEDAHAELLRRAFDGQKGEFRVEFAASLSEARRLRKRFQPDIMVADLLLPDGRGTDLLPEYKKQRTIPLVIMTSHGDQQIAAEAIKSGALDYVVKSETTLAAMPLVVERALREWQHILKRRLAEKALRESQQELQALAGRLISAQEDERTRIARELHDDFSQRLAGLSLEISALDRELPSSCQQVRDGVHRLREQVGVLAKDIHRLSRRLHSSVLENVGLWEAVKQECEVFSERLGIPVEFLVPDPPPHLPENVSLCLYRVAQESLRNVAKHAQSPRVRVTLKGLKNGVQLSVRDFGVGFDPYRRDSSQGLGLVSMRERVRPLQGRLAISSKLGEGTEVKLRIPLRQRVS